MHVRNIIRIASLALAILIAVPASPRMITGFPQMDDSSNLRARQLLHRLEHISDVNKSELTKYEKYGLRKEVKGIRKELKSISDGVHFSLGIAIMIVFLLSLVLS